MSVRQLILCAIVCGLLLGLVAANARAAEAQGGVNVTVSSLADTTSTCSKQGSGTCTLRDAITFANSKSGANNRAIIFSVSGTVKLTNNLPNIKYPTTIDGSGQDLTISGQGAYRIFTVGKTAAVTLKALTLTKGNGETDCGTSYGCGGAIKNRGTLKVVNSVLTGNNGDYQGGAIYNVDGVVTVDNTIFSNNSTDGYYGLGGAIYNSGTLNISKATFTNSSALDGGAIFNAIGAVTVDASNFSGGSAEEGAAIYSTSFVNVTNSTFSNNELAQSATGVHGGAIYNNGGSLTINGGTFLNNETSVYGYGGAISNSGTLSLKNSTVSGNYAQYGGGVYNVTGTATVTRSTFVSNRGWGGGGGLYNDDNGTMIVTNSTLTENTAEGANGGGIYNFDGTLYVTNSTVFRNYSASLIHYAGGIYNDGDAVTLRNTVVADNSENQCYDYAESLTADHFNIDDDGTCGSATQKTVSQIGLLALGQNGGPTQTMKPSAKSVLRNAGDNAVCAATVGAPNYGAGGKDQRGVTRPQGVNCDVGAYEAKAP